MKQTYQLNLNVKTTLKMMVSRFELRFIINEV